MRTELRVRFHELDPNGHVNHGVYMNWFETARIDLLDQLGFGLDRLRERGVHIVVTHVNLRFLRPAVARDVVVIESEVRELRRATSWWHQRALRDGHVLAEAEVRSGTVDGNGVPMLAPVDLTRALRALQEEPSAPALRALQEEPSAASPSARILRPADPLPR
jgi:acyl-CoA thioester hydrolase